MADVARIAPELKRVDVPDGLKLLPGWLCWRAEQHEGEPKPRKIPYWASGGKRSGVQGSVEDCSKLVTFAAALSAAQRLGMTGVGFAPLPDFGVTVLDFDKCVGPNGEMDPRIEAVVARTFSEYSPSGLGVHAVLRGNLGDHRSQATTDAFGLDVFSTKGFVTFTGNALPHIDLLGLENTIAPVDDATSALVRSRIGDRPAAMDSDFTAGFEPILGLTEAEIQDALDTLDPDVDRDDWIRVGMALHHETRGAGFDLWDIWSSGGSKYPGEDALRQQWESFERRAGPGRRQVTMASVLKMVREVKADDTKRVATVAETQAKADTLSADLPAPQGACTPKGFEGKFPIVTASSVMAQPPIDWLIKGILPAADLGVLFGASGSGKSFVSLNLAACIALGLPWRGHKVKQGKVVIVTAEGGGSYGKRIRAYCQHHNLDADTLPIGIINAAPNILEADDIGELAASIKALGGVSLLIIDTLAQVTPGANENTSEDMGRALANAMVLRRATGAMVLLIHHAGKDLSRGARGWSGIKAAVDAEIEVVRHEDKRGREIRLTKQKEGEDDTSWGFTLARVPIELDADGEEVTSCVAVAAELPAAEAPESKGVRRRGRLETHVLEMIETLGDVSSISLRDLVDMCADALPKPEGRDVRRQTVVRAVKTLSAEKNGPLALNGSHVLFYQ